jgi:hypothetical protein
VSLEIVLTKIALKFLTLHGSMKKKSNLWLERVTLSLTLMNTSRTQQTELS